MNERPTTTPRRRSATIAGVAITLALAVSLAAGVRQITAHIHGRDLASTSAATGDHAAQAERGPGLPAPSAEGRTPDGPARAGPAPDGPPPDGRPPPGGVAEPGPVTLTSGPVVGDEPGAHTPRPDRVAIETGPAAAARAVPQLPGPDRPGTPDPPAPRPGNPGGGGQDGGGPGTIGGSSDDTADRPIDGTTDLTLGARVETTGHVATVFAGVGGGLDGGLAALTIDFGDGRTLRLSDDQVARLRPSGRISVVHEYAPTLTRQPQVATVTAVDGAGNTYERALPFDTRAAYKLSYSPLTVTALTRCDTFNAEGDFDMTWKLDSRPARRSVFKLAKGESFVEGEFRVAVSPLHYGEPPEFFEVTIEEKDPPGAGMLAFWRFDFKGPPALPDPFFTRGPVARLGAHHYDVTMGAYPGEWDDCHVRMSFTAYLTMIDATDG